MKFKYKQIGNGLGFSPNSMLETILKNRGVISPKDFLNLNESNIEDFHLYDNMDEAVNCYNYHLKEGSKIGLLIDFDSDGYTSGAEIYLYTQKLCQLLNINFNVEYIIHAKKEHGLTEDSMLKIQNGDYKLVIIPDAGSNNYNQHEVLKRNNIDTIILDHHHTEKYSDNAIIVNNQLSSKITNKAMTGVGVTYKFCKALDEFYNINLADDYLDLVAFGMIADHCDLTNLESRYLVLKGLELIQNGENKNKFITTIYNKKSYNMNQKVTIHNVAFYMCPFVNCIIRGGDYETKVILFKAFIGQDGAYKDQVRGKGEVTYDVYGYMGRMYDKLKKIQDKRKLEGVELLSKQIEEYELNKQEILVVNGEQLPSSEYNRLIVNQLSSNYNKHCILLRKKGNNFAGSATGCKNKEITNFRQWCNDTGLFVFAEGHNAAFGTEIEYKNIEKLYEVISQIESSDILTYNVDGIFNDKTLNKTIVQIIAKYSDIWGNGIDEPLFAIENVIIDSDPNVIQLMGKSKTTIKFIVNGIEFIKFKTNEELYNEIMKNKRNKFTIIGKFSVNEYQGNITPQIMIEDMDFEESNEVKKFKF